jgi:FlaA1/EpsC-like NDP-sugar epimerase
MNSNYGRVRNRTFLQLDLLFLPACVAIAYSMRFEGWTWVQTPNLISAAIYIVLTVPLRIALYRWLGLYRRVWEQASIGELEVLARAAIAGTAITTVIGVLIPLLGRNLMRVPLSVLALDALLTSAVITLSRYAVRVNSRRSRMKSCGNGRRVLIAGAGNAGQIMAREIAATPELGLTAVGFVDDDATKLGGLLEALPVLGKLADIPQIVREHEVAEVIIAMPSAPGATIRRVVRAAAEVQVSTRTMPGLYEILSGRVTFSALRRVEIQDLLRREPIETDLGAIRPIVTDQTVLVTGAGGSIGSELCRQIARLQPGRLVLVGHGENSIFEVCEELRRSHARLAITPVIADIRDRRRMRQLVRDTAPNAIFHAAAHKHVPLMETNVADAISNNVLGTRNVIDAAERAATPYFVLISSDKAVSPSSVMGATKRLAEHLVQLAGKRTGRPYVSVRFGNVLGSRGSVIPTFMKQLSEGGPLLVTHPEMRRYFITIPEAVQLVLQACAMSRNGEVFTLDMGEPVRIVDLATELVRLSGLQVGTDIEIRFTGTRPGEKLFEEMFSDDEEVLATSHPKILRARHTDPVPDLVLRLTSLISAVETGASEVQLRSMLRSLVPDFTGTKGPALPATTTCIPIRVEVERVAGNSPLVETERAFLGPPGLAAG